MSADNWQHCPSCAKGRENLEATFFKEVESLYGKVSRAEYEAKRREAQKIFDARTQALEEDTTLREDYSIGTDETGEFTVSYSCSCSECGFKFNFKHKETIV